MTESGLYKIKKAAAKEAAAFLEDGYRLLFQYQAVMVLRHPANGNKIKLVISQNSCAVYKNGKFIKAIAAS